MNSFTEENYLKAIYGLNQKKAGSATTNAIAKQLSTKASSVSDMIKKLSDKKLVFYKKYQGVTMTSKGAKVAVNIIRKHRLWEVFLVDKLNFKWDEVHEIAEQLEHVHSKDYELVNRLDHYLGYPKVDPHGDPIPDKNGNVDDFGNTTLSQIKKGKSAVIIGVKDSSAQFLKYLESTGLLLGKEISVEDSFTFDDSMKIKIKDKKEQINVSSMVCSNLYVRLS